MVLLKLPVRGHFTIPDRSLYAPTLGVTFSFPSQSVFATRIIINIRVDSRGYSNSVPSWSRLIMRTPKSDFQVRLIETARVSWKFDGSAEDGLKYSEHGVPSMCQLTIARTLRVSVLKGADFDVIPDL